MRRGEREIGREGHRITPLDLREHETRRESGS
jgi:hypothetical protein